MDVSVSFVCESGRLEAQSLLLAASLRTLHPDLKLVAAIPGDVPRATRSALEALHVALAPITNPVSADYPIGNKVAALAAGTPGGLRIFIDSDVLCLGPTPWQTLASHDFAAKPADIATFASLDNWQRLYARFNLEFPQARMAASVSEVLMPPYFNAGMLATTRAAELADEWGCACRAIDAMEDVQPRRPWLDQIALPIAVARLGLSWRSLGEAWNYPAHMKPVAQPGGVVADLPLIVHYHQPEVVAREPRLSACVRSLLDRYPRVASIVRADSAWKPALAVLAQSAAKRRWWWRRLPLTTAMPGGNRDIIISGIPRSGTSYLCRLLSAYDNIAVINEPTILHEWLRYAPEPYVVATLHADLRRRIDAGDAVANKLDADGEPTSDTAVDETVRDYRPHLRDRNWVLGTKNTLAYMARLDGIARVLPGARVVLCVRNPVDTLASWKGTFSHLAQGDPSKLPVGGLDDPFLPAHLERGLRAIVSIPTTAFRRAAWWRLLAQEVLRWRGRVVVVRYEDLVADPAREVRRILGPLARAAGVPRVPLAPSAARRVRRLELGPADYVAIAGECADVAATFGYTSELLRHGRGVE